MKKITLAIETSIKEGSLALLNGIDVIDSWVGNNDAARSEDLIPQIERLLNKNKFKLEAVKGIAVSKGPGSFTGLRVGIAVAKGLEMATGCQLKGVSILEAICANEEPDIEKKISIVAAGRDLFFWQYFEAGSVRSEITSGNVDSLKDEVAKFSEFTILAEKQAYQNLIQLKFEYLNRAKAVTRNPAEIIGLSALQGNFKDHEVEPLYVRPAIATNIYS